LDKTTRTHSYEVAAAILKQAAQEPGQWEEKQSQRVEWLEYAEYAPMTVEKLYTEQARLLVRREGEGEDRGVALRAAGMRAD
jgi:hypothetical protein